MSVCLCMQHENQQIEYVCLDNKCKQKLHCKKCAKYFGKDHTLMDITSVQSQIIRITQQQQQDMKQSNSSNQKYNFELADKEIVQLIEGNDNKQKQEEQRKILQYDKEQTQQECMDRIQKNINKLMKQNEKCFIELQDSLMKCYQRKIDYIFNQQTFSNSIKYKFNSLYSLSNALQSQDYTILNDMFIKLHTGKQDIIYAKQINDKVFMNMEQLIMKFSNNINEIINIQCGQFQSYYMKQLENCSSFNNNINSKLKNQQIVSKNGTPLFKSNNLQNNAGKQSQQQQVNQNNNFISQSQYSSFKNESNIKIPQSKFYSYELKNLNKDSNNNNNYSISQNNLSKGNNTNISLINNNQNSSLLSNTNGMNKLQNNLKQQSIIKQRYNSNSMSNLPTTLTPDNINLFNTYKIRSIANLDKSTSEYFKDLSTPFKTHNYMTQTQKTIMNLPNLSRNGLKSKPSFDDDNNFFSNESKHSLSMKSLNKKTTMNQLSSQNILDKNNSSSIPSLNNNQSNNIQSYLSAKPILNQLFERQIKSVIKINNDSFIFGTIDGYLKLMEINNEQKCVYEIESNQVHSKLDKLKKCWEDNITGEIFFFTNGIDDNGQNSIKLWLIKKGIADFQLLFTLSDLHGKNIIDQVLFMKMTSNNHNSSNKIIHFATLAMNNINKKQNIKICCAKIDFNNNNNNNIVQSENGSDQNGNMKAKSCKIEILTEIVEDQINKIRKLSHFDEEQNRLFAYSGKQIIQYNLDNSMQMIKKLNKIIVSNKVDYIKAIIPLSSCIQQNSKQQENNNKNNVDDIEEQDEQTQTEQQQQLPQFMNNDENIQNYILLFTHEGLLKIMNSNNLQMIMNEIKLSQLDNNFNFSSQISKAISSGSDGIIYLVISNIDDQTQQQIFEFNVIYHTMKLLPAKFKEKITKLYPINSNSFISIEDYQDLNIWEYYHNN